MQKMQQSLAVPIAPKWAFEVKSIMLIICKWDTEMDFNNPILILCDFVILLISFTKNIDKMT